MLELSHNCLQWFRRYHFLYIFGFLINFKPINPFIYEHISETMNLNETDVLQLIYPLSNYTSAAYAFLAFLLVSFFFFNYGLSFIAIGGIVTSVFYMFNESIPQIQVAQGITGVIMASEMIYFVSIFLCDEAKRSHDFLKLSAHIRAAALAGKAVSALLAHILISNEWMVFTELSFFGVPACAHATLLLVHMPPLEEDENAPTILKERLSWTWSNFKNSFLNYDVLKLSFWYSLSLCGFNLITVHIQPSWTESQHFTHSPLSNGVVEGGMALLSFFAVLAAGTTKINWEHRDSIFAVTSLLQSVVLIIISGTSDLFGGYVCYIIYGTLFHFMTTCVSSEIAGNLSEGAIGIVFCFINLLSMIFNLIFVIFVGSTTGLGVKFLYFGLYHMFVSLLFAMLVIFKCVIGSNNR